MKPATEPNQLRLTEWRLRDHVQQFMLNANSGMVVDRPLMLHDADAAEQHPCSPRPTGSGWVGPLSRELVAAIFAVELHREAAEREVLFCIHCAIERV